VVLLVALAIIPVLLAAGLAVDGGRYLLARSRLAQAADAAALAAGARPDTAEARSIAERLLRANFPEGFLGLQLEDVRVAHDEDSGRITLETTARMPTTFMRVAHIDSVPVTTRTVVVRAAQPMEIALVLDVTGSMASNRKIDALKRAARDLVEIVFGGERVSDLLRVAVVPFSSRVNVGNHHRDWLVPAEQRRSPWRGCVEARYDPLALSDAPPSAGRFVPSEDVLAGGRETRVTRPPRSGGNNVRTYDPPCPPKLLPLEGDRTVILGAIDALSPTGTTRIDMGARWGWRVLSRRWEGLWGEDPRHPDAEDVVQAVVIMTDGDNETRVYDEVDDAGADANLRALCASMKAAGYIVYTVTFQAPAWADTMMAECATSPSHFFRSPTATDLRAAFRQIGSELSALRIAE
jgi:Flp pilus assembly protein TadG